MAKTLSLLINAYKEEIHSYMEWQSLPKAWMTVYLGLLTSTLTSIVDSLVHTPCFTK